MNYFVGLEMSWLQKCPSDKHLRRLAASLTHDQTRELYSHFDLNSHFLQQWKNMEYQYGKRDVVDMHFFALLDWKRNYENSTFEELLRSLKKVEVNTCVLCEVSVNLFALLIFTVLFKGYFCKIQDMFG
jgi:hypothetical protein